MPDPTEDLALALVELYERLSSWEHAAVRGTGLTLPQMHCLEILGAAGPLRMKELAERLGVTTGTLTALADRLEQAGCVERCPDPGDRRAVRLRLTDLGRERFAEHHALHLSLTRSLAQGLTPAQAAALARSLREMAGRM